jgi:hypothetical protein
LNTITLVSQLADQTSPVTPQEIIEKHSNLSQLKAINKFVRDVVEAGGAKQHPVPFELGTNQGLSLRRTEHLDQV